MEKIGNEIRITFPSPPPLPPQISLFPDFLTRKETHFNYPGGGFQREFISRTQNPFCEQMDAFGKCILPLSQGILSKEIEFLKLLNLISSIHG